MKRKLFFVAAALAVLAACGTSSTKDNDPWGSIDPADAAKKSSTGDGVIRSNAMNRDMTYSIWLPAGYDKTRKYPFLYLLHGYEDANQSARHDRCWLDKGNAAVIADDYQKAGGVEMIIVMPNGLDKFYTYDGYEQYFEEELIPQVEQLYGGNGKRAIAGLSMGGYGTLYHALTYPRKFTYAYAMSPAANVSLASMVTDVSILPGITVETGEDDMTTRLNTITPFVNALENKGVDVEFITRSGGHEWPFWKACLPKTLRKAGESFK